MALTLDSECSGDELPVAKKPKLDPTQEPDEAGEEMDEDEFEFEEEDEEFVVVEPRRLSLEETEDEAVILMTWASLEGIMPILEKLSQQSVEAHAFCCSVFKAVAFLHWVLYTKDDLYRVGRSYTLYEQCIQFWENFSSIGEQLSLLDACKWIVKTKIDGKKYPLVGECDIDDMLHHARHFFRPLDHPYKVHSNIVGFESTLYNEIKQACIETKSNARYQVENYIELLIELFKDHDKSLQEALLIAAVKIINIEALYNTKPEFWSSAGFFSMMYEKKSIHENFDLYLKTFLRGVVMERRRTLRLQVRNTRSVFTRLSLDVNPRSGMSEEVCELVEFRRRAEGDCFISRKHLIWAFAKLGYGVPDSFRQHTGDLAADHPPYDIYWTSILLAKSLGDRLIEMSHFAFALLNGEGMKFFEKNISELEDRYQKSPVVGKRCSEKVEGPVSTVKPLVCLFLSPEADLSIRDIMLQLKLDRSEYLFREFVDCHGGKFVEVID